MADSIYDMGNRELLHYEYHNRSSDLASELADRLEMALGLIDVLTLVVEEMTDNELVINPHNGNVTKLETIKQFTE